MKTPKLPDVTEFTDAEADAFVRYVLKKRAKLIADLIWERVYKTEDSRNLLREWVRKGKPDVRVEVKGSGQR